MSGQHEKSKAQLAPHAEAASSEANKEHRRWLWEHLGPRVNRAQLIVGLLCALLGIAIVAQVQQDPVDSLSTATQDQLVRFLDEATSQTDKLNADGNLLREQKSSLLSDSDNQRAAQELVQQRATTQGILAGTLPVTGPGISLEVPKTNKPISALKLYNVLEELRNAGAESIELNGIRLIASSSFVDSANGVVVDGQTISAPYKWLAIGDPHTLSVALSIPGGALASLNVDDADQTPRVESLDSVNILSVKQLQSPEYAQPSSP